MLKHSLYYRKYRATNVILKLLSLNKDKDLMKRWVVNCGEF